MDHASPSLLRDLKAPLVALVLGILPFFVFVGSRRTTTVNGQVVQDSAFNVLGLILAAIGLIVAWRAIVAGGAHPVPRAVVAGAAILLCVFQLAVSAGVLSLDDVRAAL